MCWRNWGFEFLVQLLVHLSPYSGNTLKSLNNWTKYLNYVLFSDSSLIFAPHNSIAAVNKLRNWLNQRADDDYGSNMEFAVVADLGKQA